MLYTCYIVIKCSFMYSCDDLGLSHFPLVCVTIVLGNQIVNSILLICITVMFYFVIMSFELLQTVCVFLTGLIMFIEWLCINYTLKSSHRHQLYWKDFTQLSLHHGSLFLIQASSRGSSQGMMQTLMLTVWGNAWNNSTMYTHMYTT